MSKKEKGFAPVAGEVSFGSGYVIQDFQVKHLEGRLLTLIESFGMRETQEKAVKDLVRKEVWDLLSPCFVISNEDHTALRMKYSSPFGHSEVVGNSYPSKG